MSLSERAARLSKPDPNFDFCGIFGNLWNAKTNLSGWVSLGLAENTMMHDRMLEHIQRNLALTSEDLTYGDGKSRVRASIARFLTRHLRPVAPVLPEHVTVSNGCTTIIEHVSWALGNPGDEFLLGRPYYGAFVPDLTLRMGTKLVPVGFGHLDPLSPEAVSQYEDSILDAKARGVRVAAIILANPHNPLGRSYPRETLMELMAVCQRHGVHLVSDEIYALSTFSNRIDGVEECPFQSVLSIDTTGLIDASLVHVIWGISKDFGANGLRLGALVSQANPGLLQAIFGATMYTLSSTMTDHVAANVLDDDAWTDKYIADNSRMLSQRYEHAVAWAVENGIDYAHGVTAGFFLWINLGGAYTMRHGIQQTMTDQQIEDRIAAALMREKAFIASGSQFGSERPGWFRIVFSHELGYLNEGLDRVIRAISSA